MVGINVPIPVPIAYYTFGGWKALRLRRPEPARPGRLPLLHQDQDGHLALAVRHQGWRGVRHPDDELRPVTPNNASRAERPGASFLRPAITNRLDANGAFTAVVIDAKTRIARSVQPIEPDGLASDRVTRQLVRASPATGDVDMKRELSL